MTRRPAPRQRRDPAGLHPVHLLGGGEAVHQHDRLALARIEKGDLDRTVVKGCHGG